MTVVPTIETPRLILRALRESDVEPFCAAMAQDDFARHITAEGRGLSHAESWRRFCFLAGHWNACGFGNFAVEEKSGGAFMGHVGPLQPPGWPGFEIGWAIFPRFQGYGYAAEAAAAAFCWAHEALGRIDTLHMIDPGNGPSEKVARALGAEPGDLWTPLWPDARPVRKWTTRWDAFTASRAWSRLTA